jgi:hypothetical protein
MSIIELLCGIKTLASYTSKATEITNVILAMNPANVAPANMPNIDDAPEASERDELASESETPEQSSLAAQFGQAAAPSGSYSMPSTAPFGSDSMPSTAPSGSVFMPSAAPSGSGFMHNDQTIDDDE